MATERRRGMRKSIEVDVVIDNQPASLLHGRIGNVSIGGLFVRTEPAQLAANTQVELVLMLQQEEGTRVYRLPAIVARLTPNGAGLVFDQYDVNAFRVLVVLLLAKNESARGAAVAALRDRAFSNPISIEGGDRAALTPEAAIGSAATAVAPAASISAQPSPTHGEPN